MSQLSSPKPAVKRDVRPEKAPYVMPKPVVSKIVMWFPDRFEQRGYPAVVTEVGDRAVSVSILLPNQYAIHCKAGVRHRGDPDRAILDKSEDGVWDFASEGDEELSGLLGRLDRADEKIAALTEKVLAIEVELIKARTKTAP